MRRLHADLFTQHACRNTGVHPICPCYQVTSLSYQWHRAHDTMNMKNTLRRRIDLSHRVHWYIYGPYHEGALVGCAGPKYTLDSTRYSPHCCTWSHCFTHVPRHPPMTSPGPLCDARATRPGSRRPVQPTIVAGEALQSGHRGSVLHPPALPASHAGVTSTHSTTVVLNAAAPILLWATPCWLVLDMTHIAG